MHCSKNPISADSISVDFSAAYYQRIQMYLFT